MADRTNAPVRAGLADVEAGSDPLDLLEWALAVFSRRLEQAARRSDLHGELDRAGYLLTRTLDASGPATVNELAEHLGLDGSTVTRQLSALEAGGFVQRQVDPDDRRSRILALTPKGRRSMRAVREARRQRIDAAVDDWPADDVATLGRLIDQLNHAFSS